MIQFRLAVRAYGTAAKLRRHHYGEGICVTCVWWEGRRRVVSVRGGWFPRGGCVRDPGRRATALVVRASIRCARVTVTHIHGLYTDYFFHFCWLLLFFCGNKRTYAYLSNFLYCWLIFE